MIPAYMLLNAMVIGILFVAKGPSIRWLFPLLLSISGLAFVMIVARQSRDAALFAVPVVALIIYINAKRLRVCRACTRWHFDRMQTSPGKCPRCGESV